MKILHIALTCLFLFPSFLVAADVPSDANLVNPIKVGQALPAITLTDMTGKAFDLNKAVAKKPAVLIVYRGGWCPYCNTHMGELAKLQPKLVDMGYQIIAISPELPKYLKESSEKNSLTYGLYSDSKADAIKALGLAYKVDDKTFKKLKSYDIDIERNAGEDHRILPVPAAIIVDRNGEVKFSFAAPDYTQRVDTALLLKAAEIYK